jgi:regulation of enolase protein 1 (concanavalin A-like superfamily)
MRLFTILALALLTTASAHAAIPAGWSQVNIGPADDGGAAAESGGTWTISGSGSDIWTPHDRFYYVYTQISGDVTMTAHVASQTNSNEWAKAGVMFRQNTNVNDGSGGGHCPFVMACGTPSHGTGLEYRDTAGEAAQTVWGGSAGPNSPTWVRLQRSGNVFISSYSTDGTTWTALPGSPHTTVLTDPCYVGFAVCGHGEHSTTTAVFDNVSVTTAGVPAISSATTISGTANHAFSYQIVASNSPTSYNATSLPTGLSINTSTGAITGTPTAAGTSTVALSATNASGAGTATLTLTINPEGGGLPSPWQQNDIGSVGIAGDASYAAGLFTVTGSGSDIWTGGDAFHFVYQSLNGDGTIVARVASLANTSGWAKVGVMIRESLNANATFALMALTPTNGAVLQYRSATDGGCYSDPASGAAPAWVKLVRAGNTFTGYVSTDGTNWTSAGSTTITMAANVSVGLAVTAHDNAVLNTSTFDNVTVMIGGAPPAAPVISSATTATGQVGLAFSYQITASNTPTSYSATPLPAGLAVNTGTGVITGTPTATGITSVSLGATNAGGTGTTTLTVTVNPATPVISSATTASGAVNQAFTYQITASNSPTSYNATGLPAGLTVNTGTGAITGTPTATGTPSITLSATNAGGTGTATLTVTITALPTPPVINSATTASGAANQAFSYQITAANSPTSFNATGLPAGLTINTSTGAITGTPTTAGTTSVALSATNAAGTGTATLTLTIIAPPTVVTPAHGPAAPVTGTTAPVGVLGGPALSEPGLTYTWSMVLGPAGGTVTFSPNGTNAGKNATATFTRAGSYQIQVVIANPANGTATVSGPVTVTVAATLTSIVVTGPARVNASSTGQFVATARDQFAQAMATQPAFTWTAAGGTVNAQGLFTADATAGNYQVTAAAGGVTSGPQSVEVVATPPHRCGAGTGFVAFLLFGFCFLCLTWLHSRRAGH